MKLQTIPAIAAALFFLLPGAAPAQQDATAAQAKSKRPASGAKAAAKSRPAPVVGSAFSAPERKLGAAKEPCVYKPVMSDEDIQRCR